MNTRTYAVVTTGYWAYTLSDGALRMLVLLHFNQLGFSPLVLAALFLPYELVGVATNLIGGWVGAQRGLSRTLIAGLGLQVVALSALTLRRDTWGLAASVIFVMAVQALSGVAKDLTKMSSKSAIKFIAGQGSLFRLVAILTGSKNALKGVGFFLGAALLNGVGYNGALYVLAGVVAAALMVVLLLLDDDLGTSSPGTPLTAVLSKSSAVNRLSAARVFLFGARDIWFVVALPVFFDQRLGWSFEQIGGFLAIWVIGYGIIQSLVPKLLRAGDVDKPGGESTVVHARLWALVLTVLTTGLSMAVFANLALTAVVIVGLLAFGAVFAVNSSLHSYLILAYSKGPEVALDVGFYYSANAVGRLVGTALSGLLFLFGGLPSALAGSAAFACVSWLLARRLPPISSRHDSGAAAH